MALDRTRLAAALATKRKESQQKMSSPSDDEDDGITITIPKSSIADSIMQKRAGGGEVEGDDDLGYEDENMPSLSSGGHICSKCGHVEKMSEGGEVTMDDDQDDFLDPAEVNQVDMGDRENDVQTSPASEEEDDEQEDGKIDLKHILNAIRAKHRGR